MRPALARLAALPALACAAALAARPAGAVDLGDGQLSVHGEGEWSYQRTTSRNALGVATEQGEYDTTYFGLVLAARAREDMVVSSHLGFTAEGASLDWAFAEWRLSERLRLRLGKVQQPIGNLNELRFSGTTRIFYDLPSGIYGPANVLGTSYLGAGLTGQALSTAGWSLAYDAYFGAVMLEELESYGGLVDPADGSPVAPDAQQARDLLGGRLTLITPGDVELRASAYGGQISKDDAASDAFYVWGLSAAWRGERLWVSGEAFRSVERGSERAWAAYAAAGWFLTEHLQAALRHEVQRTQFAGHRGGHPLLRHDQLTVGLNYWVNPSLVLKASYARVEGNRFALPPGSTLAGLVAPGGAPPVQTGVIIAGTQFSF